MPKKLLRTGLNLRRFSPSPQQLAEQSVMWGHWLERVKNFCRPSSEVNEMFTAVPGDNRPYVIVLVHNERILALLDSGANQTILGSQGLSLIKKLKLTIIKPIDTPMLRTADGTSQPVLGFVTLPVTVDNVTKDLNVMISDTIGNALTLGTDFCNAFKLTANFANNSFTIASSNASVKVIQSRVDLNLEQVHELTSVVKLFQEIGPDTLGRTPLVEHVIETGDARSIKQRYYPLSPVMLAKVNAEIDDMLRLKVIRPSKSAWNSPIVMVQKNTGELRMCFDGRRLNEVTRRDAYPIPYVSQILDRLRDARYLTSIDLRKAFWQIPLSSDSCEKTAFTVPGRGLFEFTVLPFGLHNSPQTLQRLMDALFGPELVNVFVYIDDIIVVSSSFEEHLATLTEVYKRLKDAGLTVNIKKCEFCRPSLNYLGFVVDEKGLRTDPGKVSAIVDYPTPKNTTEIK